MVFLFMIDGLVKRGVLMYFGAFALASDTDRNPSRLFNFKAH
jgi:hypothetical protein